MYILLSRKIVTFNEYIRIRSHNYTFSQKYIKHQAENNYVMNIKFRLLMKLQNGLPYTIRMILDYELLSARKFSE